MADDSQTTGAVEQEPVFEAPRPGSQRMPRWSTGELREPPKFTWRNWAALLGPGLVMGGSAIGGGEWLTGPIVTAKYGGSLFWLATLSILGQVVYNIEISRYALYSGEPIFTGKFRTLPGPLFWPFVYLVLDFGAIFPYLAATAATPLAAVILGEIPRPDVEPGHQVLLRILAYVIFLTALIPLLFGGKIFNSLKAVMSFKIVVVLGFLLIVGTVYASPATWEEIFSGFFKFGTVPIERGEDLNGNGKLDPGEDWDRDGHLDVVEERIDTTGDGKKDGFVDADGDGYRDGNNVANIFTSLATGKGFPDIDFTMISIIAAMVAIAGSGGLSNTPVSNYTRDQGWGMGWHVGAIPSVIGGRNIKLSHVGCVFEPNAESLPRWKRWYRHVMRDQLAVWMPACFFGLALPSILSVEFLRRGTVADKWTAAGMTADAVGDRVAGASGSTMGNVFWFMTLFCGFLVLAPSMATSADGFIRRWVDAFWTASSRLRKIDPKDIGKIYFRVLIGFAAFGLVMLSLQEPTDLLTTATLIFNFALGFSCWHTLVLNCVLLPRELRPGWFVRIALFLAGVFFWTLSTLAALDRLELL